MGGHLSRMSVARHLERHFRRGPSNVFRRRRSAPDTALHSGKDLAVSPACCHAIFPREDASLRRHFRILGNQRLSALASLFAPRGLLQTGITRYRAAGGPAYPKACRCLASVRTFLSGRTRAREVPAGIRPSDRLIGAGISIHRFA